MSEDLDRRILERLPHLPSPTRELADAWQSIDYQRIRECAQELLDEDTARLSRSG